MSERISMHGRSPRRRRNGLWKSQLTPARQRLVEDMQRLGYGRYKKLVVCNGQPVLDPPPRRYRHRRLHGANQDRKEDVLPDFRLKDSILKLFEEMDRLGSGVIARLEVRDGLPYDMTIKESAGR